MSTATSPARALPGSPEARSSFFQARLASAFGVLPLAVWTIVHLWHNLSAFQGAEAWQRDVTEYPHPIAQAVTGVVVLLPLVVHTVWGIGRLVTSRPNNLRYGFYDNLKYALQRLSAIAVVLFLGGHIWLALLRPRLVEGHAEPFADIAQEMHYHWPTLATYILAPLAVAYHLANGCQQFLMTWGVVSSQRALKRLEGWTIGLFVVVLGMAWATVYALWAAGGPA
jgi:succinate dehydrogenase / fumarate reductase cytochrome b subunit